MTHHATAAFWRLFERLPEAARALAKKQFQLLKENPQHPSLRFKRIGRLHSVRVGLRYRALGVEVPDGVLWFWIGSHTDYDKLVTRSPTR